MITELFNDIIPTIENKKNAIGLIHKVYHAQLKTSRVYTASTKTKSEVRGGGRKPWRQKGTGNARAGSIRSSIWVGGGVSFGPKPRVVKKKINKKEKRLAIFSAFCLKKTNSYFLSSEKLESLSTIRKTREILNFLQEYEINSQKKVLIIISNPTQSLYLATRNLKNIKIILANSLNLKEILFADTLLFSKESLEIISSLYGNSKT
jgi:large subunit ribosomal protein L4